MYSSDLVKDNLPQELYHRLYIGLAIVQYTVLHTYCTPKDMLWKRSTKVTCSVGYLLLENVPFEE